MSKKIFEHKEGLWEILDIFAIDPVFCFSKSEKVFSNVSKISSIIFYALIIYVSID